MEEKHPQICIEFRRELWKILGQINNGPLADPDAGFIKVEPNLLEDHIMECPTDCLEAADRILSTFWGYLKNLLREVLNLPMAEFSLQREEITEMLRAWPEKPTVRMDLSHWGQMNEFLTLFFESQRMSLEDAAKLFHELAEEMEKEK